MFSAKLKRTLTLLVVFALVAIAVAVFYVKGGIAERIDRRLSIDGIVDLAEVYPGPWERICIFGPYSSKESVSLALGFPWDVEWFSEIHSSDGISLLVFISGNGVGNYVDYKRRRGDFAGLSGQCFTRLDAKFTRVTRDDRAVVVHFP